MDRNILGSERLGTDLLLYNVSPLTAKHMDDFVAQSIPAESWPGELIKQPRKNSNLEDLRDRLCDTFLYDERRAEYFKAGFAAAYWLLTEEIDLKRRTGPDADAVSLQDGDLGGAAKLLGLAKKEELNLPTLLPASTNRYWGRIEEKFEQGVFDEFREQIEEHLQVVNPGLMFSLAYCWEKYGEDFNDARNAFFAGVVCLYDIYGREAEKDQREWQNKAIGNYLLSSTNEMPTVEPEKIIECLGKLNN